MNHPVISFPHLGSYHIPLEVLLGRLFEDAAILPAPAITRRTLELGNLHSPDYVCAPFKYNMGNFIEALEGGANVLIQAGGGCRYAFYAEVQEQILRDMGYEFEMIKIIGDKINPLTLYGVCRRLGSRASIAQFAYSALLVKKMIAALDEGDGIIRKKAGFELHSGELERLREGYLSALRDTANFRQLNQLSTDYLLSLHAAPTEIPQGGMRVGLIGELYTIMEPFANLFMERELAAMGITLRRFITVTYLLFEKTPDRDLRNSAAEYIKYPIGATGTDSVAHAKWLAQHGYDGIIHVKAFGCTPEVNAIPVLQNISRDYNIPILYFSFDSQTSEAGIRTRLEAFADMLKMRKNHPTYAVKCPVIIT